MAQLLGEQAAGILAELRYASGRGLSKKQICKMVKVAGELHVDVHLIVEASGLRPEQVRSIVQRK